MPVHDGERNFPTASLKEQIVGPKVTVHDALVGRRLGAVVGEAVREVGDEFENVSVSLAKSVEKCREESWKD